MSTYPADYFGPETDAPTLSSTVTLTALVAGNGTTSLPPLSNVEPVVAASLLFFLVCGTFCSLCFLVCATSSPPSRARQWHARNPYFDSEESMYGSSDEENEDADDKQPEYQALTAEATPSMETVCTICLASSTEPSDEEHLWVRTQCNHWFHQDCFELWEANCRATQLPPTCPLCREYPYNFGIKNDKYMSAFTSPLVFVHRSTKLISYK